MIWNFLHGFENMLFFVLSCSNKPPVPQQNFIPFPGMNSLPLLSTLLPIPQGFLPSVACPPERTTGCHRRFQGRQRLLDASNQPGSPSSSSRKTSMVCILDRYNVILKLFSQIVFRWHVFDYLCCHPINFTHGLKNVMTHETIFKTLHLNTKVVVIFWAHS